MARKSTAAKKKAPKRAAKAATAAKKAAGKHAAGNTGANAAPTAMADRRSRSATIARASATAIC